MKFTKNLLVLSIAASLAACGGSSSSNQAPQFSSANYNFPVVEDKAYTGSVSATDSDPLTYTVASAANNGVFALNKDGTFTYTPKENFYGEDTVRVQASDGSSSSTTTITFTITNENDAPVLVNTDVTASSLNKITGQINVEDVDGDKVTFKLVKEPESGTLVLNPETGAFTYDEDSSSPFNGSFKVTFTDGIIETPVEAEISLAPSYVTNQDKLNYYYSSEHSHLKQAEAIRDAIPDDAAKDEINANLAEGYAFAGFFNQTDAILENISRDDVRSRAYRIIGRNLAKVEDTERTETYLTQSQIFLNEYIANKGIDNLSSSDAGALLTLVNNYIDAGLVLEAQNLLNVIKVYAETVRQAEYNTIYGNFLTAFRENALGLMTHYLENKTPENYQRVLNAAVDFAELAIKTGYRIETRGAYAGQRSNRLIALYTVWAAETLYNIGAIEEAKKYTNYALSLYGVVGLDTNYNYPASENAEVTKATYAFPLTITAGLVAGLYPNASDNPALVLLTKSRDIARARENIFAKQMVTDIIAGKTIDQATQPAYDYFIPKSQYTNLYLSMTEDLPKNPRGARLLYIQGYQDQALALLEKASSLLTTEAYVDNNSGLQAVTGSKGCARLVQMTRQFGGDALAQAKRCEELTNTYLTTNAGKKSTVQSVTAYKNLIQAFYFAGDRSGIKRAGTKVLTELELLDKVKDKATNQLLIGNFLLNYGLADEATPLILSSLDNYKAYVENGVTDKELNSVINKIKSNVLGTGFADTGFNQHYAVLKAFRFNVTNIDNFAEAYQSMKQRISTDVAYYTEKVLSLSPKTIQDNIENLLVMNFSIGNSDMVNTLINHEVNAEADNLKLKKQHAKLLATKNDFPSTLVASVDSDDDGLPNFFLSSATEEQIEASGLKADDDADNDGIKDSEDKSPLTP